MTDLAVEYRPIGALIPCARNARTHSEAQVAQIAASIRAFGFTNPVLLDGASGILAGHGRVLAARQLGIDRVPCIELAHLSDTQRRAYVIADNKLALNAGWDEELLRLELADLRDMAVDLNLTGFDAVELSSLFVARETGETDLEAEWQGMPEFAQRDKTAFRSLAVHFRDAAAVDAFAKLVGQPITGRTRFLWFPRIEIETYADKRYAGGGE